MSDLDLCPVAVSEVSSAAEDQPQTLQDAAALLLEGKEYCEVTLTFPNLPDRIEAHEIFLKARSPVFKQIFRMRKSGNVQGKEIEISESTPERFQEFLEFIYMDKFEVNAAGALDLLHLAQKYKVQPLTKRCEELLETEMEVEDAVQVFETARRYGRDELVDRAGEIMVKSLAHLIEIDALKDAEEKTIIYLLERDDLTVKEVNLFELIVKWGKQQGTPSNEADRLQTKLKNVIPLIRYTNMTPYQFNAVVSATGLLSAEEIISVYSYFAGDEVMRENMQMKFNITRRKVETYVDFYAGNEDSSPRSVSTSSHPLKLCMSFQAQTSKKLWPAPNKPVITGIKIKRPSRCVNYCSNVDTTLNFTVFVKECSGAVNDQNLRPIFQKSMLNCKDGGEDEIPVEPAVKLISGVTYCITVEDQSQHHRYPNYSYSSSHVSYTYSGVFTPYDLSPEATADLGGVDLKLNKIQKESRLSGYPHSTAVFPINAIRGIKVALMQ